MKTCRISLALMQVGPNWLDPRLALRSVPINYFVFILTLLFSDFFSINVTMIFFLTLEDFVYAGKLSTRMYAHI